jgi:hypothetical protein
MGNFFVNSFAELKLWNGLAYVQSSQQSIGCVKFRNRQRYALPVERYSDNAMVHSALLYNSST